MAPYIAADTLFFSGKAIQAGVFYFGDVPGKPKNAPGPGNSGRGLAAATNLAFGGVTT